MKHILIILLVLTFILIPGRGWALAGDLDNDLEITQNDVNIAMQIAVGKIQPTWYQKIVGDINRDGRINSADAGLIARLLPDRG